MTIYNNSKKCNKYLITLAIFLSILIFTNTTWSWEINIHSLINKETMMHIPGAMSNFTVYGDFLATHSIDADLRRSYDPDEAPRHYMDIDNFSGFFTGNLPHNLDSLIAQYGHQFDVIENGIIPFAIELFSDSLRKKMAAGEWLEALLLAADLGHYVADAHQPLHTTKNYDGQLTGNDGIHARYETEMINRHLGDITILSDRAIYITSPVDFAFQIVEEAWVFVDSIMLADDIAKSESGGVYDEIYYNALWRETGDFTINQIQLATEALASLWYTAWVNAGMPEIPSNVFSSVSIKDIQYTIDPSGMSPLNGQVVTISGIVTAEHRGENQANGGISHAYFFVSDSAAPWCGIQIYYSDSTVAEGDSVTLTGTVDEYYGETEIKDVTDFIRRSTRNLLPGPLDVTTAEAVTEAYEGCLVRVSDVTIVETGIVPYNNWRVDDGSGAVQIDMRAKYYYTPVLGAQVKSLTGIVKYSDNQFTIAPRLAWDIVEGGEFTRIQRIQQVRNSDLLRAFHDQFSDTSYANGDTVKITGVVTMPTGLSYAGAGIKFILSETGGGPWSSILSYHPDSTAYPNLFEGDVVEMTGYIGEYRTAPSNMTEFWITSPIQIVDFGQPVPEPDFVATGDLRLPVTAEQWENCIVYIEDAEVVEVGFQYELFSVDDGSGAIRIDDDSDSLAQYYSTNPLPVIGTMADSIRGWVYHHFGAYNDSSTYKLEPLYMSDIVWKEGWKIIGQLTYYLNAEPVDSALVKANSIFLDTTDYNGNYELMDLPPDNYVVRPEKENDTGNSISAYDAAWILQYGVGLKTFSPYQLIAGDVSGNGTVSAYDAAMVLQYGVGLINKFPVMPDNIHFWRFVPEDFAITSTNWTAAPDSIAYTPLNSDTTDNYYGIIYGDVSGNWSPSGADLASLGKSSGETVDIRLEDISGETGDRVILPIVVESSPDIVAMSFTLEYDARVLKALNASTTEITENWQIAHNIKEGLIKVALAGSKPITTAGAMVNLEFEVLGTELGERSIPLDISEITINEGNIAVNIQSAKFTTGTPLPEEYALSQNYPNPFNAQTVIKYQLPKSGRVVLKIFNTLGQEVRTLVDEEKEAGYHSIYWDGKNDEGSYISSGIYIYRIQAGDFVKVRKMLFLM